MSHRRSAAPRIVLAATVAVLVAAPAVPAAERPPSPDETAAAAVYREFIPTAVGPRPASGSAARQAEIPLSPAADAAISAVQPDEGSAFEPNEGSVLEEVATSLRYGAPERPLPAPAEAEPENEATLAVPVASDIVSTTTSGRILALALVLLAVTGLLGGFALRRRRGRVSSDTSFG